MQKHLFRVPSYPSQQYLFFLLLLGVNLSFQETLGSHGLVLPIRVDSLFSPWMSWTSSCPPLLPDSWPVRPGAGSLASIYVCSGANAVGSRSRPWPELPAMSAEQERFPNGFLPNLLLFLFCIAGSVPSSLTRAAVLNSSTLLLKESYNHFGWERPSVQR